MDLQRTEAPTEGDLLFRGDALVAEHQHVMIQMGAVDTGEVGVGQRPGQVQPDHLGTQGGTGEGTNLKGPRLRRSNCLCH
ncbi:hypothetical protein FQZ97_673710 [compost metagenome]